MDPTERFSNRVADYVKFRPSYPAEVIALLEEACGFQSGVRVADVGSGTGIFSQLLLAAGAEVFAVEPNEPMRLAAESALGGREGFHSISGTAEKTTLPSSSVQIVTCAQSFHWFASPETLAEFRRILTPDGWIFLVWNHRLVDTSPLSEAYEALLLQFAPDYANVRHRDQNRADLSALAGKPVEHREFAYRQTMDREAFVGRVTSSSYVPALGSSEYEPFVHRLQLLFDRFEVGGCVEWQYRTDCYLMSVQ